MIGWQQSTSQYASHFASDDGDSNLVVCEYQTSSFTTLVYRIDSGECLSVSSLSCTDFISLPLTLYFYNLIEEIHYHTCLSYMYV